jgi:hypothetical protein
MFAAALFAVSVGGLGAANAMPLAPLSAADTASVIQVAQGCGPGYSRGRMGECRPDFRRPPPRRYAPPPMVRRCPPGFFPGPYGRCARRY